MKSSTRRRHPLESFAYAAVHALVLYFLYFFLWPVVKYEGFLWNVYDGRKVHLRETRLVWPWSDRQGTLWSREERITGAPIVDTEGKYQPAREDYRSIWYQTRRAGEIERGHGRRGGLALMSWPDDELVQAYFEKLKPAMDVPRRMNVARILFTKSNDDRDEIDAFFAAFPELRAGAWESVTPEDAARRTNEFLRDRYKK